MVSYPCPRCGLVFGSRQELGGHLSVPICGRESGIPALDGNQKLQHVQQQCESNSPVQKQDIIDLQKQDIIDLSLDTPDDFISIYELLQRPDFIDQKHTVHDENIQ